MRPNDFTNTDFPADGRCRMGRIWVDTKEEQMVVYLLVLGSSDGEKLG